MRTAQPLFFLPLIALVLLATGPLAPSQPQDGTIVLSAHHQGAGLYYVTRPSSYPIRTIKKINGWALNSIKMSLGNAYMMGTRFGAPYHLLLMNPTGTVLTQTVLKSAYLPDGMETDQDGSYVFACSDMLLRLDGLTQTTLAYGPGKKWNCICRDKATGDFVVGEYASGRLMQVDRRTGRLSTISTVLGTNCISGVAYVPQLDCFAVTRLYMRYGFVLVNRFGTVVKQVAIRDANAVTVDEKTGRIYVATLEGEVVCLSDAVSVVWSKDFGDYQFSGIDVWGDQTASAFASGQRGTEQVIGLRFNRSYGKQYVCALSLGIRPAITVAGPRYFNLVPDVLFSITAGQDIPGFTRGFLGFTSSRDGHATARFTIPKAAPIGLRIYFSAVALNPAFPGSVDLANTEVIKVWAKFIPLPLP